MKFTQLISALAVVAATVVVALPHPFEDLEKRHRCHHVCDHHTFVAEVACNTTICGHQVGPCAQYSCDKGADMICGHEDKVCFRVS